MGLGLVSSGPKGMLFHAFTCSLKDCSFTCLPSARCWDELPYEGSPHGDWQGRSHSFSPLYTGFWSSHGKSTWTHQWSDVLWLQVSGETKTSSVSRARLSRVECYLCLETRFVLQNASSGGKHGSKLTWCEDWCPTESSAFGPIDLPDVAAAGASCKWQIGRKDCKCTIQGTHPGKVWLEREEKLSGEVGGSLVSGSNREYPGYPPCLLWHSMHITTKPAGSFQQL